MDTQRADKPFLPPPPVPGEYSINDPLGQNLLTYFRLLANYGVRSAIPRLRAARGSWT
jgi:hypothetical protein